MNATKRMTSIARRINRAWVRKLFRMMFLLDVLVLALAVAGFCLDAEARAGVPFGWETARTISVDHALQGMDQLYSAVYRFAPPGGEAREAPMRDYILIIEKMFTVLLWCEGGILLLQMFGGARGARRQLKPLQTIATQAKKLSEETREVKPIAGEDKIHHLEDAIEAIPPDRPDVRLSTGDSDLQGLEDAINSLLSRMHEAYREQVRFVSDASHELRTPIAVIQGYASMLDRWGKKDEAILNESIQAIKSESEHMKKLIEQLLFLARGDGGRQKLTVERFSLSALMREVYEESEMIDALHEWRLIGNGPEVFCAGDQAMLKQVARILTDNAAKYTPEGGRITLSAFEKEGVPCFEVRDTGAGISGADLPRVFERFYRSDPSRDGRSGGTGLGLSIAKWIVERHGGYFEVLSRESIGTRITVCLPETDLLSAHTS